MKNTDLSAVVPSFSVLDAPAVWVGCLAAYNAGTLYGRWIAATSDEAVMLEEIAGMLAGSPVAGAEEWDIMDYNAIPSGVRGLSAVAAYIGTLEALEDNGWDDLADIVNAYVEWRGIDWGGLTADDILDSYIGHYDTVEDYAYEYVESAGLLDGVDKTVARYFDYGAFARDLELGGDVYHAPSGHLFHNN